MFDVVLRPAEAGDAHDIARILRAALASFDWMPQLHTPDEDLYFVRHVLLAHQAVTVVTAADRIVGFISIKDDWVEQLYFSIRTGPAAASAAASCGTPHRPCPASSSIASRPIQAHAASTNATTSARKPSAMAPATKKACLMFSMSARTPAGSWLNG